MQSHNLFQSYYLESLEIPPFEDIFAVKNEIENYPFVGSDLCVNLFDPVSTNVPQLQVETTKSPLPSLDDLSEEELQDIITKNYRDQCPSMQFIQPLKLFLRWIDAPPDRVHATSPSKLNSSKKSGGRFSFSVQVVAHCTDGSFAPFNVAVETFLYAKILGKHKVKTQSGKVEPVKISELVALDKNPIGNPLLASGKGKNISPVVKAEIPAGESIANFLDVSLSCGSNAARSKKAPEAARDWDWDYYLTVETPVTNVTIRSVLSKHITTDSNRSQTREKRKRPSNFALPEAKRFANHPIAPYHGLFQPLPINHAVNTVAPENGLFSTFKSAKLTI